MSEPLTNNEQLSEEELLAQEQSLLEQARALREKRELLRAAKLEQKKQEEANKPILVEVFKVEEGKVFIKSAFRDDLVNLHRTLTGRFYHGDGINSFPIEYWSDALERMSKLPGVSFDYINGVSEILGVELKKPDYEIDCSPDSKYLWIKVGRANSMIIQRLPGSQWDGKQARWTLPIVEGWRLYEKLEKQERVIWSTTALNAVLRDIERRHQLDQIALKQDSDIVVDLGPHTLRPFQKVGVEFTDAAGGRVILADQMGLGKTWQAIAYARLRNLRTLVICPAGLKTNWAREIVALTGERPAIHTGQEPQVWDLKAMLANKSKFHIINYDIMAKKIEVADEKPSEHDPSVILKTNMKERWLWIELINMSAFDLVVLDEAHYIKNVGALRSRAARLLKAPRIMAMTGTPVLNRPGELWPILTLLAPEKFPDFEAFIRQYTFNNKEARNVDELRELLKPMMLRRLKKDVVKELPPINRVYKYTELSEKAKKMYQKVLAGVYEILGEWQPEAAGEETAIMSILAQIMRLKQITSVDKIDFVADLATEVNDSLEERNGKREDKEHKVIIFTQFVPIAHAIAKRLGQEAVWMTGELDKNQRQTVVDKFKSDPEVRFLVATDKVAGEGLNLQEAHAVIFTDLLWTPAGHEQCEGRAYGRLASLHSIDSYWVVCEDTIDEDILEILDRKLNMINQVVEGMDSERNTSVVKELLLKMKGGLVK